MAKRGRPSLDEVLSDVKKAKQHKTKVKRTLKSKEDQIKKLEIALSNKRNSLKKSKEVLAKLDKTADNQVVSEEQLQDLPKAVQDAVTADNVLFQPNEGPQILD